MTNPDRRTLHVVGSTAGVRLTVSRGNVSTSLLVTTELVAELLAKITHHFLDHATREQVVDYMQSIVDGVADRAGAERFTRAQIERIADEQAACIPAMTPKRRTPTEKPS